MAANKKRTKEKREREAEAAEKYGKAPSIKSTIALACRIAGYFIHEDNTVDDKGRTSPYCMNGLYIASRLSGSGWCDYINGMHDNRLLSNYYEDQPGQYTELSIYPNEVRDIKDAARNTDVYNLACSFLESVSLEYVNKPIKVSEVLQKARMRVSYQNEKRLKIQGRVADIAVMKMQEGWIEEDRRTIVHEHSPLPTNDEALQALQALKLLGQ